MRLARVLHLAHIEGELFPRQVSARVLHVVGRLLLRDGLGVELLLSWSPSGGTAQRGRVGMPRSVVHAQADAALALEEHSGVVSLTQLRAHFLPLHLLASLPLLLGDLLHEDVLEDAVAA